MQTMVGIANHGRSGSGSLQHISVASTKCVPAKANAPIVIMVAPVRRTGGDVLRSMPSRDVYAEPNSATAANVRDPTYADSRSSAFLPACMLKDMSVACCLGCLPAAIW